MTFNLPVHPSLEDDFRRALVRGLLDLLQKTFPEADYTKWNVQVDKAMAGLFNVIIHAPLDRYHSVLLTMPDGNREGSTNALLAKFLLGHTDKPVGDQRIDRYCDMNLDNSVWDDFIGWVSLAKTKYEEVRFPRRFTVMNTFVGHRKQRTVVDTTGAQWRDFTTAVEIDLFPWPENTFVRVYLGSKADKPFNPEDEGWCSVKAEKDEQDIIQRGWVVPTGGWDDHHLIPEWRKETQP